MVEVLLLWKNVRLPSSDGHRHHCVSLSAGVEIPVAVHWGAARAHMLVKTLSIALEFVVELYWALTQIPFFSTLMSLKKAFLSHAFSVLPVLQMLKEMCSPKTARFLTPGRVSSLWGQEWHTCLLDSTLSQDRKNRLIPLRSHILIIIRWICKIPAGSALFLHFSAHTKSLNQLMVS